MKKSEEKARRYLTLPEVARFLGLGMVRRTRKRPAASPVAENERLARPVRRLIQRGLFLAERDEAGNYLVRFDCLLEYADRREAAALRRQREARGSEWPGAPSGSGPVESLPIQPLDSTSCEHKSKRIRRADRNGRPLSGLSENDATTHHVEVV